MSERRFRKTFFIFLFENTVFPLEKVTFSFKKYFKLKLLVFNQVSSKFSIRNHSVPIHLFQLQTYFLTYQAQAIATIIAYLKQQDDFAYGLQPPSDAQCTQGCRTQHRHQGGPGRWHRRKEHWSFDFYLK